MVKFLTSYFICFVLITTTFLELPKIYYMLSQAKYNACPQLSGVIDVAMKSSPYWLVLHLVVAYTLISAYSCLYIDVLMNQPIKAKRIDDLRAIHALFCG